MGKFAPAVASARTTRSRARLQAPPAAKTRAAVRARGAATTSLRPRPLKTVPITVATRKQARRAARTAKAPVPAAPPIVQRPAPAASPAPLGTRRGVHLAIAASRSSIAATGQTPGGHTALETPGGTQWRQLSPAGPHADHSRRTAAGFDNPGHEHSQMLPLWQKAAASPVPPGLKGKQAKDWLMDPSRRFDTHSPGGTFTGQIMGHGEGVLGHLTSAGLLFNTGGHLRTREQNLAANRQTAVYHGIEEKRHSAASGSKEPGYESPRPDRRSDPSLFDRSDPRFTGGPWHSWERIVPRLP